MVVGMADMVILGTKTVDLTVNSNQNDLEQNAKLSELIEKLKSAAPSTEVIFT
jgi:tryptophan synthase alpha subunit